MRHRTCLAVLLATAAVGLTACSGGDAAEPSEATPATPEEEFLQQMHAERVSASDADLVEWAKELCSKAEIGDRYRSAELQESLTVLRLDVSKESAQVVAYEATRAFCPDTMGSGQ